MKDMATFEDFWKDRIKTMTDKNIAIQAFYLGICVAETRRKKKCPACFWNSHAGSYCPECGYKFGSGGKYA